MREFSPHRSQGVYVHIPFCARRCPYCDFTIAVRRSIPHEAYRDAILAELEARAGEVASDRRFASIFFGGGTPSMLKASCIGDIIRAIKSRFGEPLEVSLEANPVDLVEPGRAEAFAEAGVTRLSLGVQSFDASGLGFLGRDHDGDLASSALERALGVGFASLNCDLIFGHAEQSLAIFEADLRRVRELGVPHISTYSLTIEEGTPFGRRADRGERLTVEEDLAVEMHAAAERVLGAAYTRYEISSLARGEAHRCLNNLLYWHGGDYLGLGIGAHSCRRLPGGGAVRAANGRDLKRYLAGESVREEERLDATTHLAERLFLGLRTRVPLHLEALAGDHPEASLERFGGALDALEGRGWVERIEGGRVVSTARGLLFHDSLSRIIFESV